MMIQVKGSPSTHKIQGAGADHNRINDNLAQ